MNETKSIRGQIKSMEVGGILTFPLCKRRAIYNYTSDLRVIDEFDFDVKTITGTDRHVLVKRTK